MKKACLTPGEIAERLREAGVRPTAQRVAVAGFVLCESDHPTAEQVKRWTDRKGRGMSLATVYNALGALVRAGLLREFKLPHTGRVVYDPNVADHYHFLDEASGKLMDVDSGAVELRPRLGAGFRVRSVEVLFRGRRE